MQCNRLIFFFILGIIVISYSQQMSYISNSFKESTEHIRNPDQGFYRPLIVYIKPDSFYHQPNDPEQIYHLRCDMSEFSGAVNSDRVDKKLTDYALNSIDGYLSEIKRENKNAIIRYI